MSLPTSSTMRSASCSLVALRAGVGAAVLLGVTAVVDSITTVRVGPPSVTALADAAGGAEAAQADGRSRQDARQDARQEARQVAREAARPAGRAQRTVDRQRAADRDSLRDPRSAARALVAARAWSGQFGCLDALWWRESRWNPQAYNHSSGAFGIPQALPAGKMASAGADWRTNPVTQIRWGLGYIASRYGTPCGAWAHSRAHGWY